MSIKRFYKTCYRLRPSTSLTNTLRPYTTYDSTEIHGYLGSRSNNQINITDKDTIESRYNFYCDDFNILSTDLIKYDDKTYEIVSNPQNTANRNHHMKIIIRKVDNVKQQ